MFSSCRCSTPSGLNTCCSRSCDQHRCPQSRDRETSQHHDAGTDIGIGGFSRERVEEPTPSGEQPTQNDERRSTDEQGHCHRAPLSAGASVPESIMSEILSRHLFGSEGQPDRVHVPRHTKPPVFHHREVAEVRGPADGQRVRRLRGRVRVRRSPGQCSCIRSNRRWCRPVPSSLGAVPAQRRPVAAVCRCPRSMSHRSSSWP